MVYHNKNPEKLQVYHTLYAVTAHRCRIIQQLTKLGITEILRGCCMNCLL